MTIRSKTTTASDRRHLTRGAAIICNMSFALLLAAVLWPAIAKAEAGAGDATHRYAVLPDATPSDDARALAAQLGAEAVVLDLTVPGEARPLARVEAASLPDGKYRILDWQSSGPAPILRRDIRADEDLRLVEALATYLPADSTILALPGVSHRLAALVSAGFPLAAIAEPLAVPQPWVENGAEVATRETAQWAHPAGVGAEDETLGAFVDALLAEDVNGAARLRILAGTAEAYVLVHLEDVFQIGQLREDRLEMNRRIFAATGFSHDLAREARRWGQSNDFVAWAVDRSPDGNLRGHYLADAAETATLIAQLLPFNTSRLDTVPGLHLVWQGGGYWLYRIAPITEEKKAY